MQFHSQVYEHLKNIYYGFAVKVKSFFAEISMLLYGNFSEDTNFVHTETKNVYALF